MNTLRRFADTVCSPCCIDWPQPHHSWRCIDALYVLFCACMQTDSFHVFRRLVFGCHFAHERRNLRQKGAVSPCETYVRRSHATLFPDKTMSWQLGEGKKRWEWFHHPCGRVRIVSCLFGDDVVSVTTHLAWLVVAPIVGFCEHLRGRCGVFSVQGSCLFRSMCLRDRSAETRCGFAMAAIGLLRVEEVMS